jgi:hypothetical protein
VIEVLRVEDGTARAAGVESGFAVTFPVRERSPKPELEFHYGGATGTLAAGHGCVEGVPADGVEEGEVPAFLFEDVGLGFELGDLAAEEVATLTSVTSAGDDKGAASGWEGESRRWEGRAGRTGVSSFAGDIADAVQIGWERYKRWPSPTRKFTPSSITWPSSTDSAILPTKA